MFVFKVCIEKMTAKRDGEREREREKERDEFSRWEVEK